MAAFDLVDSSTDPDKEWHEPAGVDLNFALEIDDHTYPLAGGYFPRSLLKY
jgi:hypothetical protein